MSQSGSAYHAMDGRRAPGRCRRDGKPVWTPSRRCGHPVCISAYADAVFKLRKEFSRCCLSKKLAKEAQRWIGRMLDHEIKRLGAPQSIPRRDHRLMVLRIFGEVCRKHGITNAVGLRLPDFKIAMLPPESWEAAIRQRANRARTSAGAPPRRRAPVKKSSRRRVPQAA